MSQTSAKQAQDNSQRTWYEDLLATYGPEQAAAELHRRNSIGLDQEMNVAFGPTRMPRLTGRSE